MVMRVGGIVSGMDIEAMVNKLMEAERMPLERLKQQRTMLEWKRDAFRDINSKLLELDNMLLDMKLTRTYNPKTATSSNPNAVTANATSSAMNGTYEISVSQLATNEMRVSGKMSLAAKDAIGVSGTFRFHTFDENGNQETHEIEVAAEDTLESVLKKIEQASGGKVRAFYVNSGDGGGRVVLETTRTGVYNQDGAEIVFGEDDDSANFFHNILNFGAADSEHKHAANAVFKYNDGIEITARENTYTLNGITFQFHNVTKGNVRISVTTDVDTSFQKIMDFINKYNEVIEAMNKSQTEQRYRNYHPLSDEQKAEMTEEQIKLWEERAKSGILRGESSIRDGMQALRASLQSFVNNDGAFKLLSEIGITTSKNYLSGGKLEVDEEKLKAALRDNPDDVYKLFVGKGEGDERGLIHRFEEALDQVRGNIEKQAGKETSTLDNYTLGKRMKEINERISDYERKLIKVEERYWAQFTQMEKAIARLNEQANYLFAQFYNM